MDKPLLLPLPRAAHSRLDAALLRACEGPYIKTSET